MSGGVRKAAVVLPTIVTIVVVALVGSALLQQRQERSDRVAEAEKVGAAYFSDVASFQAEVRVALTKVESGDPADLKRVVDEKLQNPPVLGPAPEGAEASRTYREAVKASRTALDPFKALSTRLGRVVEAEKFVQAADDLLGDGPVVLLGYGVVFDSGPLRERVLPALNRSLAKFRAVDVPDDAREVAVKVDSAVVYVISQVSAMADAADEGRSYEFRYDTQYNAARQAVHDYATKLDGDVAEALDRVAGDKPT